MKTTSVVSLAALASAALAHPLERRATSNSTNIDVTVLQFALTLEHLENVFYKQALTQFSPAEFVAAGYNASYYSNLEYIAFDEQSHVTLLEGALQAANQTPTAVCTYDFPYSDVHGFVGLASVLEGVGTSAYLGGAGLITSKQYLTVAASILVTEAVHTSLQRATNGQVASANAYGTPLDPTSVYTLAASFIVSCPASNPSLGFTPFPELVSYALPTGPSNSTENGPAAGSTVSFTTPASVASGSFVTFVSGLSVLSVAGQSTSAGVYAAQVPAAVSGQTYVFITKTNVTGAFADNQVIAGPAVIDVVPAAPALNYSVL